MGFFSKIKEGLRKTKDSMVKKMQRVVNSFTRIDEELFEQLEETMIMSDMGVETSVGICEELRKRIKERGITDPSLIMELIQEIVAEMMGDDTELDLSSKPSVIMVIGVNGAGKTTLLSILTGLLKQQRGEVCFDGKKLTPRQRRALSYLVMQDTDYQLFASSVEEELSLGMKDDCKEKVDETLKALELSDYRERHPASLSGGQKQRVTIGAAIVKGSPVIYFDEPTSGLDYDSMVRVSKLIEQLSSSGVIVFVVSHDFEFIVRTCTEVVQLDDDGAIQNQRLSPEILKTLSEKYFS